MPARALALIAAVLFAHAWPPGARAAPYAAGELQRTTTTASAAVRNHGDGTLRIIVWYPAAGPEAAVDIGPPASPVFVTGAVAAGAPFADANRHPLVLISHGFGGVARQMTWLGAPLARRGYIVVAVDHPGTNGRDGVSAEGAYAPWERAGDLEAALALALADPALAPHIDERRIGVAGFSLGGFTGALLAGARTDFDHFARFCSGPDRDAICDPQLEYPNNVGEQAKVLARPEMKALADHARDDFRDPRIKAAFLVAPALGQALDLASLPRIHVPVEIVLGDADPIAPPATNGEFLAREIPGARLKVLPGVRHYDFLSECAATGMKVAKAYCTDGVGTNRAQTHETTASEAITFFDHTLRESR